MSHRPTAAATEAPTLRCDLLVIGSGAGGLSAAVTAAHLGLKVIVVDKAARFGGTTAWSGGWMWVPRNPLARAAGIDEDLDGPRTYLRHLVGEHFDPARLEAFLAHAPAMVQFHLDKTALRFIDGNAMPDFHGSAPGARAGGRSVCAATFDARGLGADLDRLQPPAPHLSFLGMGIGGGADLRHFLRASRAWDSFVYVARRITRHLLDIPRHGRGTRLMGGNALAGALLKSALDAGVMLLERHPARTLLQDEGPEAPAPAQAQAPATDARIGTGSAPAPTSRITGAIVDGPAGPRTIQARCGVVLACGGFAHDPERQRAWFPHAAHGTAEAPAHWSAAPRSNTGDGLRLAERAGAQLTRGADAGAWAPVSLLPQRSGPPVAFPHLVERGKPGLIAVTRRGARFVDEAGNYHSFMRALFAATPAGERPECWLVVDHRFQRRFGLGATKPWPFPLGGALRSGYLKRGRTLAALAQACGIDAAGLDATVAAFNRDAERGEDPAFGRGGIPYDRMAGDAEHTGPNPCVAPLVQGPFYAVHIVPGSLGTFGGIATNAHGQALDADGRPIAGLYAAGNDQASVMGGHYPSGGITLGPAMTFGYVLAHHAAGRPLPMPDAPTPETPCPASTPWRS